MSPHDATVPASNFHYYRHTLPIRIMHWISVIAFFLLLMSGLQIFNAHPALNWGKSSYTGHPPILEMGAKQTAQGTIIGVTPVVLNSWPKTVVTRHPCLPIWMMSPSIRRW